MSLGLWVTELSMMTYRSYKMLTVYSKNNCPFCEKAKHLLATKGIEFKTVMIDEVPDARDWLISQGHRSAPQIYKNDELFVEGGYQGLVKLSDEELFNKLGEINA
jgi:glutaredoxin